MSSSTHMGTHTHQLNLHRSSLCPSLNLECQTSSPSFSDLPSSVLGRTNLQAHDPRDKGNLLTSLIHRLAALMAGCPHSTLTVCSWVTGYVRCSVIQACGESGSCHCPHAQIGRPKLRRVEARRCWCQCEPSPHSKACALHHNPLHLHSLQTLLPFKFGPLNLLPLLQSSSLPPVGPSS
jgi:hypothetical protein